MTSWVLTISKDFPHHWDIAKNSRLWDLKSERPKAIEAGDVVYFWLSGGTFVGRVEVTSSVRPLHASDGVPWSDRDSVTYRWRFEFQNARDFASRPLKWSDVMAQTSFKENPSFGYKTEESAVEDWLRSLFVAPVMTDEVAEAFENADDAARSLADLQRDRRERVLAEIAVRRGQGRFRDVLLSAYDRQCAVTGTRTEAVLEAAHISPYKGTHTNLAANGLLLRSDIHTLFDLHLLTISAVADRYIVHVAPVITEEEYRVLDGSELSNMPADEAQRPFGTALEDHNSECDWFRHVSSRARLDLSF